MLIDARRTDPVSSRPHLCASILHFRAQRPLTRWLFPARTGEQPMSTGTAQHIFEAAKARAGIQKPGSIHLLRHYAAFRTMPSPRLVSAVSNDSGKDDSA